jgi:DNA repair exonuclease SbcCD ATPase subunit
MVKFVSIKWKNFLSYGNTWTEIELNKTNKTILLGESGSGKSTFLDALKFVCYNKPYRNITKPQLVNTINSKDCVVELILEKGNRSYKIIRGIKPNIFEIYCDGKLINQDANIRDYQLWFEKNVLGFNSKSFDQIVVVGAANFTPFMQLKPNDRRVIIEELLDLQIFGVMNNLLKVKYSETKDELIKMESKHDLIEEKIKLNNKFILELEKNREDEKIQLENEIKEKRDELESISSKIEVIEKEISSKKDSISNEKMLQETLQKVYSIDSEIKNSQKKIQVELDFFKNNTTCKTCKQDISEDIRNKSIGDRENLIKSFLEKNAKIESKINEIVNEKEKVEAVKSKIKTLEDNKIKISAIRDTVKDFLKDQEKKLLELSNPTQNVTDEKKKLLELEQELQELENKKAKIIEDRVIFDYAQNLLRDSGVKSQIIKQYLPLINKNTNKFLSSMNFFSTFYIDENFNEYIKSRGFDEFSYASFSEGEKQRIDLALLFTWRVIAKMKNSVGTNLLVMDEIFDSYLDIEATESVIELLNTNLFKNLNIFVISHKNNIADKFDEKIEFTKVKNFSKIV